MTTSTAEGIFELGDFQLKSGETLRNGKLAFKTHGELNADRSNAIVYLTPFPAHHADVEWPIGPGRALDPQKYFIIVIDQIGNGLSSSPSNTPAPQDCSRFPVITIADDIAAQHRLVTEHFGLMKLALVVGWSMGAQQTYQWAVSHPEMVERMAAFCGTAKTTPHNAVFLEGVRAALLADSAFVNGEYETPPTAGIRAFARVYAGWALSQPFYKQELYCGLGFATLADFLSGFWDQRYAKRDANNMLCLLRKWQMNDAAAGGSLAEALGSIKAKALVMPAETDLYFTAADIEAEARMIPGARFLSIPTVWGHMAGSGLCAADSKLIQDEIIALLNR